MPSRSTALRVTAALIGIVAIALVASTIPEVLEQSSGSVGTGGDGGSVTSEQESVDLHQTDSFTHADLILRMLAIGTAVFLVVATIALLVDHPREFLVGMAKITLALGVLVAIITAGLMLSDFGMEQESAEPEGEPPTEGEPGDGGSDSGSEAPEVSGPLIVVAIVLLTALAGVGWILWNRHRTGSDIADESADETTTDLVGSVAGETADRIEADDGGSLENEVFRAWREMTNLLSVDNPETSTPGEFAVAAIHAGFGREEVTELTTLFETVRYGDVDASATDERRAVEILRRVEAAATEQTARGSDVGDSTRSVSRSSTSPVDSQNLHQHRSEESR